MISCLSTFIQVEEDPLAQSILFCVPKQILKGVQKSKPVGLLLGLVITE